MSSTSDDARAPASPVRVVAPKTKRVGRYELLFRIAAGGMAEVHAARVVGEAGFQKLVAIKQMLPALTEDPEFVEMFLDEARLAAQIDSPHCVSTLDLGRADDGSLFLVMDLVVGVTAGRILTWSKKNDTYLPVPVVRELVRQAAKGLHDAHQATDVAGDPLGLVHRDVSPSNILVGLDGRVRLTDFGVAKAEHRIRVTEAGRIKGKLSYSSPEQLLGRDIDQRSDVFSLAIVAWELFASQPLFGSPHPAEAVHKIRTMPIPPIHLVRRDLPMEVSAVLARALERPVDARTPTVQAFIDDLLRALSLDDFPEPSDAQIRGWVTRAGGESLSTIRAHLRALSGGGLRDGVGRDTVPSGAAPFEIEEPSNPSGSAHSHVRALTEACAAQRTSPRRRPRSSRRQEHHLL